MPILPDYPRVTTVKKTWGEMTSYRFHRYSGEGGGNSLEILVLHAGHDSLQISQYWLDFALI